MTEKCFILKKPQTTTKYHIYIHDNIECFEDYDDLIEQLANTGENDSVKLHLNCPGGDCSIGFHIIDHLQSLPCQLDVLVEYPTYSMGAIMALCGDSLTFAPDSYIMFHDYSGGTRGKGEETHMYTTNYRKIFKNKFTKLCAPFLTKKEIERMFKGEDIYIHDDDPSLAARIKRHFD